MARQSSKKKAPIFLIMQDRQQCSDMAQGVREAGYDVHEYMTAREFLIDKRHHTGGIVLAEFRLPGMPGDELVKELAVERDAFPVVLMATTYDSPRVVKTGVDFIIGAPTVDDLLEAIGRTETPEIFDEESLRWGFEKLTQGESMVLNGVLAGTTSREIARDLGITPKTVEAYRGRIIAKTRARDLGGTDANVEGLVGVAMTDRTFEINTQDLMGFLGISMGGREPTGELAPVQSGSLAQWNQNN